MAEEPIIDQGTENNTAITETPPQGMAPQDPPSDPAAAAPPQDPSSPPTQDPPSSTTDEPPEGATARVVPEANGYKLPENAPPELGEWARANDMTQEQLDASYQKMSELFVVRDNAEKQAVRQAGEAHVKNWGDKRQYNTNIIKRALPQIDPEGNLTKMLNDSGMINHPAVLDALLSVGNSMKEGGFLRGVTTRPPGQRTAAQALYPDHPSEQ